jgi:16S rRNA (cytidine1402-2'-O)-methyltransferase
MPGTLYLVGTPIGNLSDVSERARRTLAGVAVIAAEDTRRTGRLLASLDIESGGRLVSFFDANEDARIPRLLERLRSGDDVAVVTDGGMPAIADPGFRLVRACVQAGITVDVVPGPSAAIAALVISGLPTDRFVFEGFLPRTGTARSARVRALAEESRTAVVFESPRRVASTLRELAAALGDRRVAVVREITKLHQEVVRGGLSELASSFGDRVVRGEVVLVIEGSPGPAPGSGDLGRAVGLAVALVAGGARKRDAAREAARTTGVPAGRIYQELVGGA